MAKANLKPSQLKPWLKYWGEDLPELSECECNAIDFLIKRNQNNLNLSALRYFDRKITYKEFFENVVKTAKAFKHLGVKKGDILTLVSVMTPETIYAFYAVSMIGATLNLADPRTNASGLGDYISETHSKIVLTLSVEAYPKIVKAVENLKFVKKVIVMSPSDSLPVFKKSMYKVFKNEKITYNDKFISWNDFIKAAENDPTPKKAPYDKERPLLIVHTGGTTGKPKGVMLSDYALNALGIQVLFKRNGKDERFLNIMPPFIAYGYGYGTHTPLCAGLEVVLIPQFDPQKFGRLILKYKAQHMAGVPLHYQGLIKDPKMKNADFSFIKTTGCGGDAIPTPNEEEVNKFLLSHNCKYKLCKGYGMSEVFACATANFFEHNKLGSVGIPLCHTTVGIFDPDTGKELGFGESGEICYNTPTMMLGYYNMEDETNNVIRTHKDGTKWVHSGDIGNIDEDGFVYLTNRIKRIIIRHDGFKIFPITIENVISALKGVEIAAAAPIKDKDHAQGKLPFVFIKAEKGVNKQMLEQEIREVCKNELPEYVIPAGYKFVNTIPRTPIGKIDYMKLEKKAESLTY